MPRGIDTQPLARLTVAEHCLSTQDPVLALLIARGSSRWPEEPTEAPLWGLIRIVMAQQLSTRSACRLAERARAALPELLAPTAHNAPDPTRLRAIGLSQMRAECCAEIVRRSDQILAAVNKGHTWEQALVGVKGIGPWTIAVFRIMVLRHPDVLPHGDTGLERAIKNVYGRRRNVEKLGEAWRPYRSVACWYLWRTLGNEQLG